MTEAQTRDFSNKWDSGGIKMIMDGTTIRFATAWANIVIRSVIEDPTVRMQIFSETLAQIKAAKAAQQSEVTPTAPVPAPKSGIVLTDS